MIREALTLFQTLLAGELDPESRAGGDSPVWAGRPVDSQGKVLIPAGKVGVGLLNIEEEKSLRGAGPRTRVTNPGEPEPRLLRTPPPLHLNLYLLFIAHFPNSYPMELEAIERVIAFFQRNPVLTPQIGGAGTAFPAGVEKIVMELDTLPLREQHYVWSMLGAKYMPSVLYRARMFTIRGQPVEPEGVTAVDSVVLEVRTVDSGEAGRVAIPAEKAEPGEPNA